MKIIQDYFNLKQTLCKINLVRMQPVVMTAVAAVGFACQAVARE
jgi:hypothetical protein